MSSKNVKTLVIGNFVHIKNTIYTLRHIMREAVRMRYSSKIFWLLRHGF